MCIINANRDIVVSFCYGTGAGSQQNFLIQAEVANNLPRLMLKILRKFVYVIQYCVVNVVFRLTLVKDYSVNKDSLVSRVTCDPHHLRCFIALSGR